MKHKFRNVAVIAHVDHGKTTLVDSLFKACGILTLDERTDEEAQTRVMDRLDLERERGITIAAKNCALTWNDVKINLIDTPGHADFGGEVERALGMVDGVVLLVDSAEGPLPQTKFVLKKALKRHLPIIVVINKMDRPDRRHEEVLNMIYDLFIDLGADESQIEFPVFYAIGREGKASEDPNNIGESLSCLLDKIVEHIPAPKGDVNAPLQHHILDLGYSNYLGRLAIGKIINGKVSEKDNLVLIGEDGVAKPLKITKLQGYEGIGLANLSEAYAGDIVVIAGAEEVQIGDTICTKDNPIPLPRIEIDPPTVAMRISANTSPFSGKEGDLVQPQKIFERLRKETLSNIALELEGSVNDSTFLVKGRGEFQLAILCETMRREGFELSLGRPVVLIKEDNGQKLEPFEELVIECDEEDVGIITEKLSRRRGKMTSLFKEQSGRMNLIFTISSRGLMGYRSEFMTDTRGTGIMHSSVTGYEPVTEEIPERKNGSLIADRDGVAIPYAIFNLEPRGRMFVSPGTPVYTGMVIGIHNRENDLLCNITKEKKLTNIRAAGRDENVTLTPPMELTLEKAIDLIKQDEIVEITPKSIRIRKVELPRARG